MARIKKKINKLLNDPNRFFEDYFAKRRKRKTHYDRLSIDTIEHHVRSLVYRRGEPIAPNVVFYESFNGKRVSCNPYAIFKHLVADSRFSHLRHVWAVDEPDRYRSAYCAEPSVKFVKTNSAAHQNYLRTAKYLITNNTFPPHFSKREGQIYINTQHGVPIKTMGKDARDTFGLGANVSRNFLHTDILVMPNRYTTEVMLRSHDVENLFSGTVIETGYPRTDLCHQSDAFKNDLRRQLGILPRKRVILFAPTYRGSFRSVTDQSEHNASFIRAIRDRFGDDFAVIDKSHHLSKRATEASRPTPFDIDTIDPNELLSIVDVLITDYSSIAFDFMPLRKPILYYAHDLEAYRNQRGFYLDLKELPGVVCSTADEITIELASIESFMTRYAERYDRGISEYCKHDDGNVTSRVVDTIFANNACSDAYRHVPENTKKRILIYGGGFPNNGVTTSVAATMKAIDPTENEIYVAFNRNASHDNTIRFKERVPNHTKVLYYIPSNLPAHPNPDVHCRQEAVRLFGGARFDLAIDASGYGRLWPGVIASVPAHARYIYLHNCMKSEQDFRPHLADYDYLFRLYKTAFDKLINVSESSLEANATNLPHLASKMCYVENILDDDRVRRLSQHGDVDRTKTNFINIGRYDYQKGQDRLINAFSKVNQQFPDTRLYIVGHGPLYERLRRQVDRAGLGDKIMLTGRLENPFRLLSQCDCFVMSSRYEGQGIVLLEALTLGVPCISTNIPGPRSILEEQYLVDDSTDGIAQGMADFLEGRIGLQPFDPDIYNAPAKAKIAALLSASQHTKPSSLPK